MMNRKLYGNVSNAGPATSSTNTLSVSYVVNRNQLGQKHEEKKPSNHVLPHRRRSRLGTYRASLMNQEFPVRNEQNANSVKKVSVKKAVPDFTARSPASYNDQNNGVKKRLFIQSPISRRLNMDTSSIIQASTENLDPDVTGICFIENAQSSKKTKPEAMSDNGHQNNNNNGNRKYLSSLENTSGRHLRSAKKSPPPSRFYVTKSPKQVMTTKIPYSEIFQGSNQFPRFNREKMKTPPSPFYFRSRSLRVIETPESLAVLAGIRNRHCTTNSGVTESSSSKPDTGVVTTDNKVSEIDNSKSVISGHNKSPVRKSVCSRLFDSTVSLENSDDDKIVSSVRNADIESDEGMSSRYVVRNQSINYELDNSLESAYARVNGTYDVIETGNKLEEANFVKETGNDDIEKKNVGENVESNNVVSEKQSPPKDRSPSFIVFNKTVSMNYDLDDTTETFIYNESLCNDKTLTFHDPNCSYIEGDASTIKKKKKLSVIAEENVTTNLPSTSCNNNPLDTKVNQSFNTSVQSTCETDSRRNENLTSAVQMLLSKMCSTMKHIEKLNMERELFSRRHDSLMENLNNFLFQFNREKEQFLNDQQSGFISALSSLSDLKNEIKVLIDCTENNHNSINSTLINEEFKNAEKIIDLSCVSVGVLKTPEHGHRALSKSVYNQLKTEYSCLKTPKPSTVKKNTASSRKILTPHSMSLCVQDQVDQLFDE